MKKFLLIVITIVVVDLLFQQCANPVNPTGGPKDTIPPTLVKIFPENGTTNFKGQIITIEFDEFINADKLKQNLVITPKSKLTYKHQIKKKQLILKFEEKFNDSTTYSLNFFDGVTDITEKNPVINLYVAFSTGSFIDSMEVAGDISDLFTQEKLEGYTVGLYPISDTLDFLTESPTYFTTTDKDGSYQLNYIKTGRYKIISFKDENRNLLLDPETEAHGFISDTLKLFSIDSTHYSIRTQLLNVKPIRYINSRPVAQYIEAKYSREIYNYEITPDSVYSILIGEKKDGIRIYNNNQFNYSDSIQFIINASDSLGNNTIDTLKTVFLDSNRKLPGFSFKIVNEPNQKLNNNQHIKVKFNKPINLVDTNSFSFKKDSTFLYSIKPTLEWNQSMDELDISSHINIDSLLMALEKSLPKDTIQTDSIQSDNLESNSLNKLPSERKDSNKLSSSNSTITFEIMAGAFISIEKDTSKTNSINFKTTTKESYGTLNINLTTKHESFTLQLLSRGIVSYQSSNQKKISFPKVKPGNYSIRILIDDNNDGMWSYGNILDNKEPETVFLYPEETSVRENWVIDLDIIQE